MIEILAVILGLTLLLAGGTGLVRGASGIAESYGVSPLVVGLTVVAFGTSSPELIVNVMGALQGESAIAFGNVAGSNLANLGLVLGAAAFFSPIVIQGQLIRRELPLLLLATSILLVMVMDTYLRGERPSIDRSDAIVLLMLFGIFVYLNFLDFLKMKKDPLLVTISEITPDITSKNYINWIYVVGGLAGLLVGGQITITNGVLIAEAFDVSPAIIGMVVIAVGTSLPELVTSIIAAIRKEADLCVGNVIGSNIFNALLVLPVSAAIRPLDVPEGGEIDIFASLLFAMVLIPIFFLRKSILSRSLGAMLVLAYFAYLAYRVAFSG